MAYIVMAYVVMAYHSILVVTIPSYELWPWHGQVLRNMWSGAKGKWPVGFLVREVGHNYIGILYRP